MKKINLIKSHLLSASWVLFSTLSATAVAETNNKADSGEVKRLANYFVAQDKSLTSKIDFDSFMKLAKKVEDYRAKRLIPVNEFLAKAKEPNTIILDSRSKEMYDRKHLKGALHLNFADYNQISLYKIIPDKNTTILIYCNNNFIDDQQNFASKMAVTPKDLNGKPTYQNNITLALNIPTFINLYGYGYHNVYELADLVSVNDPRLAFEGSEVKGDNQPNK